MKNDKDTDIQLIENITNDDYVSYNKLFVRYYNLLCRFVFHIIKNKHDSEDIVQELFLNLWNDRRKIDIYGNVSAYLYKAARNLTLNYIRSETNYRAALERLEKSESYFDENILELEEFRASLRDCINELPQRSKEVLLLHRLAGLKQKEISDKLGTSIKTIKNQIWMSMQKLKTCLELKNA